MPCSFLAAWMHMLTKLLVFVIFCQVTAILIAPCSKWIAFNSQIQLILDLLLVAISWYRLPVQCFHLFRTWCKHLPFLRCLALIRTVCQLIHKNAQIYSYCIGVGGSYCIGVGGSYCIGVGVGQGEHSKSNRHAASIRNSVLASTLSLDPVSVAGRMGRVPAWASHSLAGLPLARSSRQHTLRQSGSTLVYYSR